jgi:hypothetical protein
MGGAVLIKSKQRDHGLKNFSKNLRTFIHFRTVSIFRRQDHIKKGIEMQSARSTEGEHPCNSINHTVKDR